MLIKSLSYKNFRQFKGENTIEFSCDKENNVTIILGNNTFGKTTLLQMFNWCLYNKVMFRPEDNPDMLLNLDVAENMYNNDMEEVVVKILLEHQNLEYTISRRQKYKMINGKLTHFDSNLKISFKDKASGKTDFVEEKNDIMTAVINKIMPEELSGYFLFDTERVQNVAERKDLSSAVKGLLGLNAISNARKHLGKEESKSTVIGKFWADLEKNSVSDRAKNYLDTVHRMEDKIIEGEKTQEEAKEQIEKYEQIKKRLEDKIKSLEDATKLQQEKEKLEKYIASDKVELEEEYKEYEKKFSDGFVFFMAQPLYKQAIEVLENADIDDKGIKDITADSIREIIANGRCICGTPIKEGNQAYLHLLEQIKFVPPESIGTTLSNFKKEIHMYNRQNVEDRYFLAIQNQLGKITKLKQRIDEWESRVKEIEKEIEGKEDARKYQIELNETKEKIKSLQEKIVRCSDMIGECRGQKEHYLKLYNAISAKSEKNREIKRYLAYAKKIRDWFDEYYNKEEGEIRERLEEKVNKIFNRMYHGERVLKIDERYKTTLYAKAEGSDKLLISGESEGLIRVKNFAFIAGLVELAKEKTVKIGDKEIEGEAYPLILDAPFSNADEIHIKNIARELPDVAEQVIMFVMEKDWKYAKEVIMDKVAKCYTLEKHSDTYSTIK